VVGKRHLALVLIRLLALVALAFSISTAVEYYANPGTFCSATGDCARVRFMARELGALLPAIGTMAFTTVFVLSVMKGKVVARVTAGCAIVGALGAAYLVYLQSTWGAWCWLCLVIDSSTLAMGACGVWLLATMPDDADALGPGFMTYWWAPYWLAVFGPITFGTTFIDAAVPDEVADLYDADAEVNIVELADFECPFCRAMHPNLRAAIEQTDAEVNLVRVVVPLSFHAHARPAAAAYFCAVEQDHGEAMADELFGGELERDDFMAYAGAMGLDLEAFETCLDAESTEERIEEDLARWEAAGNPGLPTVFIGAQIHRGFAPDSGPGAFIASIEAAEAEQGARVRYWPGVLMCALFLGSLFMVWFVRRREPDPDAPVEM